MYLVTVYNCQDGGIEEALPAETLDDGLATALQHAHVHPKNLIEVDRSGSSILSIRVVRDDIVQVAVENTEFATPTANPAVIAAVNSLHAGDESSLARLFQGAVEA